MTPVALRAFDCVSRRGASVRQTPSVSRVSRSQLNLQELVFENSSSPGLRKKVLASQALSPRQTIRREASPRFSTLRPGGAVNGKKNKKETKHDRHK